MAFIWIRWPVRIFRKDGQSKWRSWQLDHAPDLAGQRRIEHHPSSFPTLQLIHFGTCLSIARRLCGTDCALRGRARYCPRKERCWELFACTIAQREARTRMISASSRQLHIWRELRLSAIAPRWRCGTARRSIETSITASHLMRSAFTPTWTARLFC